MRKIISVIIIVFTILIINYSSVYNCPITPIKIFHENILFNNINYKYLSSRKNFINLNIKEINEGYQIDHNGSNLICNLNEEDCNNLEKSLIENWYLTNEYGETFKYDNFIFIGELSKNISIFDSNINIVLNKQLNDWSVDYPSVSIGKGMNVRYFNNINEALDIIEDGEILYINKNIDVTKRFYVKKNIIIEGNNYELNSDINELFHLNKKSSLELRNINIRYKKRISNKEIKMENVNLIQIL